MAKNDKLQLQLLVVSPVPQIPGYWKMGLLQFDYLASAVCGIFI